MEALIDTALANSAQLESRDQLIRMKQNELAKLKNDWADLFGLYASTSYGNGSISSTQSIVTDVILSNQSTFRFGVGLSVSLAPGYWLKRKNEKQIRASSIKFESAMRRQDERFIKEALVNIYLTLEYHRETFLIANANYEANHTTVQLAEKRFLAGDVSIDVYNNIRLLHNKMRIEIEQYKRYLRKAYMDLELLVGSPLTNF
jgi:outer membrane protein TolC